MMEDVETEKPVEVTVHNAPKSVRKLMGLVSGRKTTDENDK